LYQLLFVTRIILNKEIKNEKIVGVLGVLLCILIIAVPAVAKDKAKVGFLVHDLTNPFWNTQARGAKEKAEELGIELVVLDAQVDPAREIDAWENWITEGVDGIMISCVDEEASKAYAKRAQEKGIYVVAAVHPLEGADASLQNDEYKYGFIAGEEAGRWINEKLGGEAEFPILSADVTAFVIPRSDGIRDGVLSVAPKAKLVARQDAFQTETGMTITESILQAHPNVKLICGMNDSGALGAYEAVRAAGKDSDDFFISGTDATTEACKRIKEGGIFRATVDMAPYNSGKREVEMIYNMINGVEFEHHQKINNVLVTTENVDEYLK
jgi:ABC-type sugar transport system substrate-binding protein